MGSLVDAGLEGALIGREMVSDISCARLSAEAILRAFTKWSKQDGVSQALNMSDEFHDEAHDTRNDAIKVARRLVDDLELDTDKWTTMRDKDGKLGVQYEVRHPLKAHAPGYIGYIDWVPGKDSTVWIADLKVRKAFTSDESMDYDYQLSSYQHAAGDAFGSVTGVAHYQTRSKPCSPPRVLKSGKLSKAKNQGCDWRTYLKTVDDMGLDRSEYAEMEDALPEFQRWTWTRRSAVELANTWDGIELLAERLVEAHSDTRPQPRVLRSDICGTCDMRHVCMAELKGKDSEFIRKSMYKVREDYGIATS
jgi:hypothetical protein